MKVITNAIVVLTLFGLAAMPAQSQMGSTADHQMKDVHGTSTKTKPKVKSRYTITLKTHPDPVTTGQENAFHVRVTDAARKSVTDATVELKMVMAAMPEMNMPEMKTSVQLTWNGSEYVGKAEVPMAGTWQVTVQAVQQGKKIATKKISLRAK